MKLDANFAFLSKPRGPKVEGRTWYLRSNLEVNSKRTFKVREGEK